MNSHARLLVVCNMRMHCQCFLLALSKMGFVPSVGFSVDAVEAFEKIKTGAPEVVLVDWHLPNGSALDLARWVEAQHVSVKVFFFNLLDAAQGEWARQASGRADYFLQSVSLDDLLARVTQSLAHEPDRLKARTGTLSFANCHSCQAGADNDRPGSHVLTVREQQILCLLEQGMTNKEIAKKLVVSIHTVKNHVHNLLGKLAVDSRHKAIRALRIP